MSATSISRQGVDSSNLHERYSSNEICYSCRYPSLAWAWQLRPLHSQSIGIWSCFLPVLQDAFWFQASIGWGNALKGFLSKHRREIANHDFHHPKRVDFAEGEFLLRSIIDATHELTRLIWLSQNSALHDKADADARCICDTEIAEIRHYHSLPHLSCSASIRRRWFRKVKHSAIAEYECAGLRQSLLASFFHQQSALRCLEMIVQRFFIATNESPHGLLPGVLAHRPVHGDNPLINT